MTPPKAQLERWTDRKTGTWKNPMPANLERPINLYPEDRTWGNTEHSMPRKKARPIRVKPGGLREGKRVEHGLLFMPTLGLRDKPKSSRLLRELTPLPQQDGNTVRQAAAWTPRQTMWPGVKLTTMPTGGRLLVNMLCILP